MKSIIKKTILASIVMCNVVPAQASIAGLRQNITRVVISGCTLGMSGLGLLAYANGLPSVTTQLKEYITKSCCITVLRKNIFPNILSKATLSDPTLYETIGYNICLRDSERFATMTEKILDFFETIVIPMSKDENVQRIFLGTCIVIGSLSLIDLVRATQTEA